MPSRQFSTHSHVKMKKDHLQSRLIWYKMKFSSFTLKKRRQKSFEMMSSIFSNKKLSHRNFHVYEFYSHMIFMKAFYTLLILWIEKLDKKRLWSKTKEHFNTLHGVTPFAVRASKLRKSFDVWFKFSFTNFTKTM